MAMVTMEGQQSIKIRGLSKTAHQHIVDQAKRSNLSVNKYMQQKLNLVANGAGTAVESSEDELAGQVLEKIQINTYFRSLVYPYFPELQMVQVAEEGADGN
ncbi:hypothetical protein [Listeria seeligeri]|uniref:hypothetical protein n=1 Tax=Listeria seeligeri TaxID=1640 RepID=UPI0022EB5BC3|nr:hypothetical protein [Listeria seeligeri]